MRVFLIAVIILTMRHFGIEGPQSSIGAGLVMVGMFMALCQDVKELYRKDNQ